MRPVCWFPLLAQFVAVCASIKDGRLLARDDGLAQNSWRNFTNTTTSSTTSTKSLTTLTETSELESNTSTSTSSHSSTTTALTTASNSSEPASGHASSTLASSTAALNAESSAIASVASLVGNATIHANKTAAGATDIRNGTVGSTAVFSAAPNSTIEASSSVMNGTSTSASTSSGGPRPSQRCGLRGSFISEPIRAVKADSIRRCKSACHADSNCRAFEAGTVDGNGNNCWFFERYVGDLKIGDAQPGFSWAFYDSDCSLSSHCGIQGSFVTKPIAQMKVDGIQQCKDACQGNSGCKSFESGTVDGSGNNCWLYDETVTDLNMGQVEPNWDWSFYDRDCAVGS